MRLQFRMASSLILLLTGQTVLAVAPDQQRTLPIPGDRLYSVVHLTDTKLESGSFGTGSIIKKWRHVKTGTTYLSVLTADHVIAGGGKFIKFGDRPAMGADTRTPYEIKYVHRGGSTGLVDVAVAIVEYTGGNDMFFQNVQTIDLWNPPDLEADAIQAIKNRAFSLIGFGLTGTRHVDAMGVQDGWTLSPQATGGLQRFQNSEVVNSAAGAMHGGYTYTDVTWRAAAPTRVQPNLGFGTQLPGDSGAPYMLDDVLNPKPMIAGLQDENGNNLPIQTMDVATNQQFAVATFSTIGRMQTVSFLGDTNGGALLTQAEVDWINLKLMLVPEASASILVLAALVVTPLFRYRSGRRSRS